MVYMSKASFILPYTYQSKYEIWRSLRFPCLSETLTEVLIVKELKPLSHLCYLYELDIGHKCDVGFNKTDTIFLMKLWTIH